MAIIITKDLERIRTYTIQGMYLSILFLIGVVVRTVDIHLMTHFCHIGREPLGKLFKFAMVVWDASSAKERNFHEDSFFNAKLPPTKKPTII